MMNAAAASEKWKRVWFILRPPHASSFCTVSGRRGCDGYLWGDVWSDWRAARGSDNHSAGPGHLWTSTCFHRLRLRRRPAKSKRLKFYYSQCFCTANYSLPSLFMLLLFIYSKTIRSPGDSSSCSCGDNKGKCFSGDLQTICAVLLFVATAKLVGLILWESWMFFPNLIQ